MDAYSICRTSASARTSSRIYQDLRAALFSGCPARDGTAETPETAPETAPETTPMQSTTPKRTRPITSNPHVGIIGAGLSGLRCADILLQGGFDVTIIEARDRIGGRVHQQQLSNGRSVDLGPNWIHGTRDNPILELARQTDTAAGSWDTNTCIFTSDGDLLPLGQGEMYSSMMWEIMQQAFEHSNNFGADTPAEKSLFDFFCEKVPVMIPDTDPDCERKRGILLKMAEGWGAFIGASISRQSLKYFWLEECIEGENLFCAGTYKRILSHIAAPALKRAVLRLSSSAKSIHYQMARGGKVEVELDSQERLAFDEIVVTTPLGWLQRNPDAFNPPLPPRLTKAIRSIGYGCLEKVYVSFPSAFWLDDSRGRKVNGFIQWLAPEYASSTNPSGWHQEAIDLASLDTSEAHPTLLFYMFGEQSQHVVSKLRTLATPEDKTAFLRASFHPYYSRLPNYREESRQCQPLGFLATEWSSDEFAGFGSYCNFPVGLDKGDEDVEVMREGLPDQGIWFAGEHTAPFVALGTATGAYWSGEMVGKRIREAYSRSRAVA
ncbi:uncharacterized protein UV8b_07284 [Ustilaginoidea virens]|uniref:Amine oxidase domain-containing protein n=1 Tax=Ustilaginoidea virens TaxID=1159556 RepID=A0A8E5MJW6_USTVR|nr:uncharacterized protein UV8b_07284 [Ustilaginoidea virens]QUC23043.1 hypothetical protein UV8b_07284 [Ustilaginoidea virens]